VDGLIASRAVSSSIGRHTSKGGKGATLFCWGSSGMVSLFESGHIGPTSVRFRFEILYYFWWCTTLILLAFFSKCVPLGGVMIVDIIHNNALPNIILIDAQKIQTESKCSAASLTLAEKAHTILINRIYKILPR
jgi:hypothetical protein